MLILTYKAIHGYAPLYISDLIRTGERTNYNLRSSSQLLLQPYNATKTKKTLGDRAFQVASPGCHFYLCHICRVLLIPNFGNWYSSQIGF